MRGRNWLITIGTLILAGCSAQRDRECLQAQREWDTLCRAMQEPVASFGGVDAATCQTLRETADRVRSAVVWIDAVRTGDAGAKLPALRQPHTSATLAGGSGIIIGSGLVLTNEHVIRHASNLVVELADGRRYAVQQAAMADHQDLAVLRIGCPDLKPMPMADAPAEPDARVVAVAGPHFPPAAQCRIGVVQSTTTNLQQALDPAGRRSYRRLVAMSAEIQPGFSGGPLLDDAGRLIGVNVASAGTGQHARGYAIPIDGETRAVVDDLCRKVRELR